MKSSLRGILIASLGAVALSLSPLASSVVHAQDSQEIDLNSDRVQIVHSGGYDTDYTNFNITFTNYGEGDCDGGADDAIASGIEVALAPGACYEVCYPGTPCVVEDDAPVVPFPFDYYIAPFVAHTVNHETYGTFFGLNPVDVGPGTVSARIVLLSKPPYGCGTWNLNVEATGLNLSSITSNPMSLWLNDSDGSGPFCFDIDNAIIGNQIPTPAHMVRRGVRRSR
ncbi:MAG: hypothetical protein WA861_10025 [Candidatus Binatus sp.]